MTVKLNLKEYPYRTAPLPGIPGEVLKNALRIYNINGIEAPFTWGAFRVCMPASFRPSKRYETLEEVKADATKKASLMFVQLLEKFMSQYTHYFQGVYITVDENCVWEDTLDKKKNERESYISLGDGKWEISLFFWCIISCYARVNTKNHPCAYDLSTMNFQAETYAVDFSKKLADFLNAEGQGKLKVWGPEWAFEFDDDDGTVWISEECYSIQANKERFVTPLEEGDPGVGNGVGKLQYL